MCVGWLHHQAAFVLAFNTFPEFSTTALSVSERSSDRKDRILRNSAAVEEIRWVVDYRHSTLFLNKEKDMP
jgi:hypothetical protein